MVVFITGGSGSGKSEYAEQRAVALREKEKASELIYIATMEGQDAESKKRIERHRKMREGKGFFTYECYTHLEELPVNKNQVILLDCLSNLTANEMFSSNGRKEQMVSAIEKGLTHLIKNGKNVVIVGNNVFEDGIEYDEMTKTYLERMAKIHQFLATQADEMIEVICGIPVFWKGEHHEVY